MGRRRAKTHEIEQSPAPDRDNIGMTAHARGLDTRPDAFELVEVVLDRLATRDRDRRGRQSHTFTLRGKPMRNFLADAREGPLQSAIPKHQGAHALARFARSQYVGQRGIFRGENVARENQAVVVPQRDGKGKGVGSIGHTLN